MTKHVYTSAITLALTLGANAATAQDSFYHGQVIELSAGIFAPFNTLQDTLTTPNGGGAQVQSTDALDFGLGPRVAIGYSRPWGNNARMVFNLTGAKAAGETTITIGGSDETYPGSYDDGKNLPANFTTDVEILTQTAMLKFGREWAVNGAWRVSAGLQAGQALQDISAPLFDTSGALITTVQTESKNEMYGVFGGVSYYHGIDNTMGLRLSANVGVMDNSFTYDYTNLYSIAGTNQANSGSASSTAISAQIAARLERSLTDHSMLTFEIGYEGLSGIGNGADTFLDVEGTASTAHIDEDMIGAAYISVGYALQF